LIYLINESTEKVYRIDLRKPLPPHTREFYEEVYFSFSVNNLQEIEIGD
jgi:hypothetical protein